MKTHVGSGCLVVAFTLSLAPQPSRSADLTWDPNGGATGAGGSGVWDTSSLSWNGGTAAWSNTTPDNAIFGGATGTVSLAEPITVGNLTFASSNYAISNNTLTFAGSNPTISTPRPATINSIIDGSAGLIKSGISTLTLTNGANTWAGGTTISQGALIFGASGALGSGTVTLGDANTGTSPVWLLANFGNFSTTPISNNIVVSASGTGAATIGTTTFNIGPNGTIYSGTIILFRDVVLIGGNADRTSFEGQIMGTGNLTISGRRVTLDNPANNFVGNITINPGATLQLNSFGTIPDTSSVTVNGKFLIIPQPGTSGIEAIGGLSGSTAGVIQNLAGRPPVPLIVGVANGSGNYAGVIQDFAGAPIFFTKTGSGTQVLSGANTYAGATTLNGGILSVSTLANGGSPSNIGDSSNAAGNLVFNGGTLQYTGSGASTDRLFSMGTGGGTIDASGTGALIFINPGAIDYGGSTGARTLSLTGSNIDANTL